MSTITVTVRLFGAFREYGDKAELELNAPSPVHAVKDALARSLGKSAKLLIEDSVFANENTILPGDYIIERDEEFSILPPVCGG